MLKQRIATALVLVGGLLALLFAAPIQWVHVVFALMAAVGAWEWSALMKSSRPLRYLFAAAILIMCALLASLDDSVRTLVWAISTGFWLLLIPFWLAGHWTLNKTPFLGHVLGAVILLATWAALAKLLERGAVVLLGVLATIWVADIAAYFAGRAFGKHKLAPGISPGKTWEGAIGAAFGVVVYGLLMGPQLGLWQGLPGIAWIGLLVLTAVSIVGDLFESLLKRQAGVKDSGAILPGHGGVLDRIDSLTSTLPLIALTLHLMNHAS